MTAWDKHTEEGKQTRSPEILAEKQNQCLIILEKYEDKYHCFCFALPRRRAETQILEAVQQLRSIHGRALET